MSDPKEGFFARLSRWGVAVENAALVALFGALMLLAVMQIVMRVFFNTGFVWTDELTKLIVLWITLVASIAASRSDRHLRIDIVSNFVPERFARLPKLIVDGFAAVICAILAWHSYRYLQLTIEFEDTVLVDVPAWVAYCILPFAFALMSYRFAVSAVTQIAKLLQKAEE
ncbi:MAG: TRAP transporter small permease [Pseudomonadota bacterium]